MAAGACRRVVWNGPRGRSVRSRGPLPPVDTGICRPPRKTCHRQRHVLRTLRPDGPGGGLRVRPGLRGSLPLGASRRIHPVFNRTARNIHPRIVADRRVDRSERLDRVGCGDIPVSSGYDTPFGVLAALRRPGSEGNGRRSRRPAIRHRSFSGDGVPFAGKRCPDTPAGDRRRLRTGRGTLPLHHRGRYREREDRGRTCYGTSPHGGRVCRRHLHGAADDGNRERHVSPVR
ncbi:MAG: hypothetical protein BWX50_00853 [Euryarchaeota archaeon ADurb.Bin009]|nr:MAG: hypothetical protein BWX50_00853 [Euryarchaeota archaeon ADurb.Bin009]